MTINVCFHYNYCIGESVMMVVVCAEQGFPSLQSPGNGTRVVRVVSTNANHWTKGACCLVFNSNSGSLVYLDLFVVLLIMYSF